MNLSENQISDINVLERVKFRQLLFLNLSGNKISDINALEKVDFKSLQQLNLSSYIKYQILMY